MNLPIPQLDTLDDYRARFADVMYWRPYVQHVCIQHRLTPHDHIRYQNPGTYPTFIVNDTWVIKFFGKAFNGHAAYEAELDANHLLGASGIPHPQLLDTGALVPDSREQPWRYLIFSFVSGRSLGECRQSMSQADLRELAAQLGTLVRTLHCLDLKDAAVHTRSWQQYSSVTTRWHASCIKHHQQERDLPDHLMAQLPEYLMQASELVPAYTMPVLLHADITTDHLLLLEDGDNWRINALIDWGDAVVGDPAYELLALHLDAFGCDKELLRAFLDTYGLLETRRATLPALLMNLTLISHYPLMRIVFTQYPNAARVESLTALADLLYDPDAPALSR